MRFVAHLYVQINSIFCGLKFLWNNRICIKKKRRVVSPTEVGNGDLKQQAKKKPR